MSSLVDPDGVRHELVFDADGRPTTDRPFDAQGSLVFTETLENVQRTWTPLPPIPCPASGEDPSCDRNWATTSVVRYFEYAIDVVTRGASVSCAPPDERFAGLRKS